MTQEIRAARTAAFALEAGRSIRWVADVLGNADPALTLRVYAHAMRAEEGDLSFAEFGRSWAAGDGPGRPYAAPSDFAPRVEADEPEGGAVDSAAIPTTSPAMRVVAQARVELATPAFSVARSAEEGRESARESR